MKADDFKKILRETVNEELKKVLPELLKGYFDSSNKTKVSENNSLTIPNELPQVINKNVKKEIKQYAKNPILNQILNETVVKIPTDGSMVQSDQYTHSVIDSQQLPGSLSNVFNKNYSTLLKAVDAKSKKQR